MYVSKSFDKKYLAWKYFKALMYCSEKLRLQHIAGHVRSEHDQVALEIQQAKAKEKKLTPQNKSSQAL